jgi:hypothetical protein
MEHYGRKLDADHVDPKVQILAELSVLYCRLKVSVAASEIDTVE